MTSDSGERRRGGRDARRQLRAAPLAEALRPIRPGLEGGRYRPLSEADIITIHQAALDVLEQIGMAQALPSCVDACTRGAFQSAPLRASPPPLAPPTALRAVHRHASRRSDHGRPPGAAFEGG